MHLADGLCTTRQPSKHPSNRLAAVRRRVKMTRLRMRVADRLKGAQNTYAMLSTFNEIDMTGLMQLRSDYKVWQEEIWH
jgi:2-oxoglutarate dehydrogenase E2 component (dihydrolipoamide succinyltransferase)